jgi:hypothetical protein
MVADPDLSRPDLLLRIEQCRAQGRALREQVAELAEAVAQVELESRGCMRASLPRVGRWPLRPPSMPCGVG